MPPHVVLGVPAGARRCGRAPGRWRRPGSSDPGRHYRCV